MERKNKIPNNRLERFYDEDDFKLELDMAKELIEGDMNFKVVLFRIDHTNTNSQDIYGESEPDEVVYKEPVELYIIPEIEPSEQSNYAGNGMVQYEDHGNLIFYVLDSELTERNLEINYGDIIGYLGMNHELKYYSVSNNNRINIDNKSTHYGYAGYYRKITCVTLDEDEFKG